MLKTRSRSPAPPVQATGKIGLWGAPGSGKTTFLAALSIAANRASGLRDNRLLLFGADDASTDFLIEQTSLLTRDMQFPPATDAEHHLNWVLRMNVEAPGRGFWRPATKPFVRVRTGLSRRPRRAVQGQKPGRVDARRRRGGELAPVRQCGRASHSAGDRRRRQVLFMNDLAGCDGLVLLFDPAREWEESDAFSQLSTARC